MHGVGALIHRKVQVMYRVLIKAVGIVRMRYLNIVQRVSYRGEEDGTCIG